MRQMPMLYWREFDRCLQRHRKGESGTEYLKWVVSQFEIEGEARLATAIGQPMLKAWTP